MGPAKFSGAKRLALQHGKVLTRDDAELAKRWQACNDGPEIGLDHCPVADG